MNRFSLLCLLPSAFCIFLPGCADTPGVSPAEGGYRRDVTEQLFDSAMVLLNGLDEFESEDALVQVVNRLNQWIAVQKPIPNWQVDPLVAAVPTELRETPLVKSLPEMRFAREDGVALQETVWLREAARTAVGRELEPLMRIERLWDWTVRNIQLDADPSDDHADAALPHLPWQIMLRGRGTAIERAWVFMLLARQQELDVVLLATPQAKGPPRFWLPAWQHEGELYLFDTRLGLPIPGANGSPIATLAMVVANPPILEQLSVADEPPYPIQADDLQSGVIALVEASPQYLAQRMQSMETRLAGPQRLVLSVDASALAARVGKMAHVSEAKLWTLPLERWRTNSPEVRERLNRELAPFRVLQNHPLWTGRVLQICGRLTGDRGALERLPHARVPDAELAEAKTDGKLDADMAANLRAAKQAASYWLGIASYDRGNFEAAIDYFSQRVLAASPDGPWTEGARYHLARTYETLGRRTEAIRTYQSSRGAQRVGNLRRAARLRQAAAEEPK